MRDSEDRRKWRSLVLKVGREEEVTMSMGREFHFFVLRAINDWEDMVLWRVCWI
jgi:hypothetical protein